MRFLLDSDALLRWVSGGRFDRRVRSRVERGGAAVSAVSAFELTQKVALGRIRLPGSIAEAIDAFAFRSLPVTVAHAERAARLPRHHRDPFDRLLIAQAQIESLTIVSGDEAFDAYDVDVVHF